MKIKRLTDMAKLPTRGSEGAAPDVLDKGPSIPVYDE